jgi:hypothetical protein
MIKILSYKCASDKSTDQITSELLQRALTKHSIADEDVINISTEVKYNHVTDYGKNSYYDNMFVIHYRCKND